MLTMAIADVEISVVFRGMAIRNMVLIYSPHGTNVCGSRGDRVGVDVTVVKSCFYGHFLYTCSYTFVVGCMSFSHDAQYHRQTDDSIMLVADHAA